MKLITLAILEAVTSDKCYPQRLFFLYFKYECPDSCCVVSCPVPPVPVLRIEPSTLHTLGRSSIRSHTCQPCIAFF